MTPFPTYCDFNISTGLWLVVMKLFQRATWTIFFFSLMPKWTKLYILGDIAWQDGLLRVRSRARVATGPKSIALLPLWFLKLSRTPKPLHFLLHVFIFSLLSLVIFLLGEGRDWPTFCVFLIQDWKNLCSLGTRPRIEGKRRKKSA